MGTVITGTVKIADVWLGRGYGWAGGYRVRVVGLGVRVRGVRGLGLGVG